MHEPTIATGFRRMVLDLHRFVGDHRPGLWIEPIRSAAHVPLFNEEMVRTFYASHKEGTLKKDLKDLAEQQGTPYAYLKAWFYQEAIRAFFKFEEYRPYEDELAA